MIGTRGSTPTKLAAAALVVALALTSCGDDDDGEEVGGGETTTTTAEPETTTPGSSEPDTDALVQQAVDGYSAYVQEQVDQLVADTRTFTDAVRSGDVAAAQAAYAPSRIRWERIEPIAGLIEDIDVAVDARVDDFASEEDPEWTGWHRIEYLLWEQNDAAAAAPFADQLDADIEGLASAIGGLEIEPIDVARGSAELIEEVSGGKITGEEDRYSHTDLWDFDANVDGAREAFDLLTPALQEADAELVTTITEQFDAVDATLDPYREGEGYAPFTDVTEADIDEMQVALGALSESLSTVPGVLGLE